MQRILIVDDEQDVCSLMQRCLEKTGQYEVMATSIPEEVLGLCRREKPDMIILDIVMPNVDGTEIIHSLKEDASTNNMLIIVTSGMGEMVYEEKKDKWRWLPNRPVVHERGEVVNEKSPARASQAYGVDDYIAKPFTPDTLLNVVREVFARGKVKEEG